MRLRPHHIQPRRTLAICVAAGLITLGIPPMAAHATTLDCEAITAGWGLETPVQIHSPDELYCIGEGVIDDGDPETPDDINTLDLDFELAGDIDLAPFIDDTSWRPIGSNITPFTGSFNGVGKTISGLAIDQSGIQNVGLFGVISGVSISDVISRASISNVTLASPTVAGGDFVGSLVGEAIDSTITGVTATSVNVTADSIDARVGGLVGSMTHTNVSDVSVSTSDTGSVMAMGGVADVNGGIGGVIGRIDDSPVGGDAIAPVTTVESVTFVGDVSGPALVGGVIGHADTDPTDGDKWMSLTDLSSAGSVTAEGDPFPDEYQFAIGGAIGLVFDASLNEIHSSATVSSIFPEVGGLIGVFTDSHLSAASATGTVSVNTGDGGCYVGGLIGATNDWFDDEPLTIEDVSATGAVSCTGGQDVGGLIGYVDHTDITDALASGDVTSSGADAVNTGGLVGAAYDSSFTDVAAEGNVSAEGDFVGGLVGAAFRNDDAQSRDVVIARAETSGDVRGRTNVGGIVGGGENRNTTDVSGGIQVISSKSSSNIFGIESVGGIAGGGSGDFILQDVVSTGSITGWHVDDIDGGLAPSPANYGGLVGYLSDTGSIERAYTTSTLSTDVPLPNLTIGSMIGVSEGTLTGPSFTSTDPDTLQIAGTLEAASSENAEYRSLADLGKFDTYSPWNESNPSRPVIVNGWVSPSIRTTEVWGTCTAVASGLPFLQWQQRTEVCPWAPNPPSPSPDNGGNGGNAASGSGSSQSPSAALGTASASQSSSNGSPVTQTGALPLFRQPTAAQPVTGTVTLVPAGVAAATPTRAMRQEASATLGSAPTVMATANQPVKLLVPGFTPGGTYTVQVKSNNGYVVLGSVEADANGQLQMPVFRMANGASTTTIAIVSATGEASYVKVKTTKKRGAGERNRTRGAAAGNRR